MIFKDLREKFHDLIVAVQQRGGNLIFVGGCVRDILHQETPKDFDAEVYGLSPKDIQTILASFGEVKVVGQTFGVFYSIALDIEVAIPRRETKIGKGHRGFEMAFDPDLSFQEAASRRDLTVNSMGYDPLREEVLDPWNGQADLAQGILRATNAEKFGEDPLRSLRVMQFAARFDMRVDEDLKKLCATQDLSELPQERILEEFRKLLVKGKRPSLGLKFLQETNLVRFFPSLHITDALLGWVDKLDVSADKFPLMLALMTHAAKGLGFLDQLGVSQKCAKLVSLFHKAYALLQGDESAYTHRKIASLFYDRGYAIYSFLAFVGTLGIHPKLLEEMKTHKAFDREKILPIIKGQHLLEWIPETPKISFSAILKKCHEIQLKEGIFERDALWARFKEIQ